MMTIADRARFERHRKENSGNHRYDVWLPMLLFGSVGAIMPSEQRANYHLANGTAG